jgi:gas vesicle protein
MSEHEQPYIIVEKGHSAFGAFLWGAILGAATALLFAPKSGRETQEELRERAQRLRESAEGKFTELRHGAEETYAKAREEVSERVDEAREQVVARRRQAEEALRAGKDAARKARGDLESRLAESKEAYKAALEEEAAEVGQEAEEPTEATTT